MLDDLLDEACKRKLSLSETDLLSDLAEAHNRLDDVALRLLMSGTAAGRANLMSLPRVISACSKIARKVKPKKPRETCKELPQIQVHTRFTLTSHAIDRYAERHGAGDPPEAILVRLEAEVFNARPIRKRTLTGDEQWVSPEGTLFIVHRDGAGKAPVCVTILPKEASLRKVC